MDEILKILERHPDWGIQVSSNPNHLGFDFTIATTAMDSICASRFCVGASHPVGSLQDTITFALRKAEADLVKEIEQTNPPNRG